MKLNRDCSDFLETLLWLADDPDNDDKETNWIKEATIYDFSEKFVASLSTFLETMREKMEETHEDELDQCTRSFGGNVLFSLNGHGVGFFDESTVGDSLQARCEEISGGKYRFEQLEHELYKNEDGKIDLSFIDSAIEEYREKQFSLLK